MALVDVKFGDLPEVPDRFALADPEARRAIADALAAELRDVEVQRRRCEARTIAIMDRADRIGAYSIDGHRNVRSWAASTVNWSDPECRDRARTVHLFRDVPAIAVELEQGTISIAAVRELARLRANPRCGDQIVEAVDQLVQAAKELPFHELKVVTARWEQLADVDGAHKGAGAAHDGRKVTTATLDDTFHLSGQFGTIQGAAMLEILRRFEEAEFRTDWEAGKAVHGDAMNKAFLERSHTQRRADALYAIFQAAVSTPEGRRRRSRWSTSSSTRPRSRTT